MHPDSANCREQLGTLTWSEIRRQMDLWPITLQGISETSRRLNLNETLQHARIMLTGAGTSFYAAAAIAAAWPRASAVASTDLLVDAKRLLNDDIDVLISVARSGNSPESVSTVERVHSVRPRVRHYALTCNSSGALAQSPFVESIVLDPRTEDQSLAMTGSFSNLVVAGLALANPSGLAEVVAIASRNAEDLFERINASILRVAAAVKNRIVLLSSSPLFPWAREGSLKATEMAGGRFPVLAETYLGLRHGPMAYLQSDTVVLCLLSNQANRRNYELDLVRELNAKGLGHVVSIGARPEEASLFHDFVDAVSPAAADQLRTAFEIMGPQLLGYHLGLAAGLDPDNPSPEGVINRVVQGVKIYSPSAH